jgi:hypothetical protein
MPAKPARRGQPIVATRTDESVVGRPFYFVAVAPCPHTHTDPSRTALTPPPDVGTIVLSHPARDTASGVADAAGRTALR